MVRIMSSVIKGKLRSMEAVKEYNDCIHKDKITTKMDLEEDQKITETVLLEDAP